MNTLLHQNYNELSSTSNQDDTCIQEPAQIINNESKNNNALSYDTLNVESDEDIIRINDDLSNLDDILNSNEKTIEKSDKSFINSIPDLHAIPLLESEDISEENWGNILMNPKKKNLFI